MDKLTSLLAVVDSASDISIVLAKATTVARSFGAKLTVLARHAELVAAIDVHCRQQGCNDHVLRLHDETKVAAYGALELASTIGVDLVVKAPAGLHPLRRWTLDTNDWRLARDLPVPLLLTRPQLWSQPLNFGAAVDAADAEHAHLARAVLQAAGFLALGTHGDLDILYSERELFEEGIRMERTVRLAQLVREFHVGCEKIRRFEGAPEKTLPAYVQTRRYDVLVLGGHSRRQGFSALVPGVICRLIEASMADVLLVNPRLAQEREDASAGEQLGYEAKKLA
jgi:hypothetical protein